MAARPLEMLAVATLALCMSACGGQNPQTPPAQSPTTTDPGSGATTPGASTTTPEGGAQGTQGTTPGTGTAGGSPQSGTGSGTGPKR